MLIGLDEFPFHQIAESFAGAASGDPSWNDGHYVCVADHAGRVSLTSSLRLYPNNDVLDGFVCLRHAGRQYNIRLSRRLRPAMDDLAVGPLAVSLIEPMKQLRITLSANDIGIELDLLCRSTVVPEKSPVETTRVDGRLISDRTTYELVGTCSGWVSVAGERFELADDGASFFRNHSWGMHPGRGGPRQYGAPSAAKRRTPGIRQWVLFHMPDHGGHFFTDPSGRRAAGRGVLMTADGTSPVVGVDHELEFYPGDRRLKAGTFSLTDAGGETRDYAFEDLGWVYNQGGGYFGGWNDRLGQGVYRGEQHAEGEVWDVSHPTTIVEADGTELTFDHDWAENFVRLTGPGGAVGSAHYECVVIREAEQWKA